MSALSETETRDDKSQNDLGPVWEIIIMPKVGFEPTWA
jgi:hypothetical protein